MRAGTSAPIVFFVEGRNVPATRFRVAQFLHLLRSEGIAASACESSPPKYLWYPRWLTFRVLQLAWGALVTLWLVLLRSLQILRISATPHHLFLQRDLLFRIPWPNLETWAITSAKKHGGRALFDIDDAIYLTPSILPSRTLQDKIARIVRLCDVTLCGNRDLLSWVRAAGGNPLYIPTVVDTELFVPRAERPDDTLVIGWIGVASNLAYLKPLEDILNTLHATHPFQFVIVTNSGASSPFPSAKFPVELKAWSSDAEVQMLQTFDIGVMPLPDSEWSRGKCGFKLLQYMSVGLPTVASNVGANREITLERETGFLAATTAEWHEALSILLSNSGLRRTMGAAARKRVEAEYSLHVWYPRWRSAVLGLS